MLLVKENNKVIKKLYIDQFKSDEKFQAELHKAYQKKQVTIECDCQPDHLKISVAKSPKGNFFLRNFSKQGDKHQNSCRLYTGFIPSGPTEVGWKEEEGMGKNDETHYNISLETEFLKKLEKEEEEASDIDKSSKEGQPAMFTGDRRTPKKTKVTIFGVGTKVSMMTYQALAKKKLVPQFLYEYRRQSYNTLTRIHPNKRSKSKSLANTKLTSYSQTKNMKANDRKLVVMPLVDIEDHVDFHKGEKYEYQVLMLEPNDFDDKKRKLFVKCSQVLFEHAKNQHQHPGINGPYDKESDSYRTMVFGHVRFNRKNPMFGLEFTDLAFVPISKMGLWVESEYERHVFNSLTDQNIVFYKPHESLEYYHDLTPDIMIQNPEHPERWILCEIFGRTEPDYLERKAKKIARMNELKHVDTWYWDATKDPKQIPDIVSEDFRLSFKDFERK